MLQYKLALNVAGYFAQSHQEWMRELESGNPLAHSPKWISVYETFPGHVKRWQREADRLHVELYGKQPDF